MIAGVVLLAGAAFVELALRAADQVDCGVVEELTVVTPLVLPTVGGVQLQVVVGVGEMGQRPVSIYSRNAESDSGWVLHARGVLGAKAVAPAADLSVWPPLGAAPVDVDGAYQRFAELGYEYGRAFQGLTAMWRRESELFADVAVPDDVDVTLSGFGIHPLVLDAALHAMGMVGEQAATMLPFSWQGVSCMPRVRPGFGRGSRRPVMARCRWSWPIRRGYRCCRYRHWSCVRCRLSCCRRPSPLPMPQVAGCWKWRGCQWNWRTTTSAPTSWSGSWSLSRTVWVRCIRLRIGCWWHCSPGWPRSGPADWWC